MSFSARILADSIGKNNDVRLTTMEVTFPRFILAEMNTHRVFSRNSASSRAVPTRRILTEVRDNPFIPESFGTYQPGMVSGKALEGEDHLEARNKWIAASRSAIESAFPLVYGDKPTPSARDFLDGCDIPASTQESVHKEFVNRLLEPFMWHTAIISSTEWDNFFDLRCAPDAQPEIRKTATLMRQALDDSTPTSLDEYSWHLPLVTEEEKGKFDNSHLLAISSGRCARVSYLTHGKKRSPEEDIDLSDRLIKAGHMSPFEHQAKPIREAAQGNFNSWAQYRQFIELLG